MTDIPDDWLFPASLTTATAVQRELAQHVVQEDNFGLIHRVAGVDVSNNPRSPDPTVYAAICVLDAETRTVQESVSAVGTARFPYVPGFLGFREAPTAVDAFSRLSTRPDLLFVDGHGISHPRGLGIASHLGVVLDIPAVGVAKSILVGELTGPLDENPGASVPLVWRGRTIAFAVRTRRRANPVYVSTGHRISLKSAVEWVIRMATGYRLPEPTRQAHIAASIARRG